MAEIAIIGGGLIGLSIALELATQGASVRVYDAGDPGRAASWAGAGMLAPMTEAIEDAPMRKACIESLSMYPAFVERITQASGLDPRLRLDGILSVAYDATSYEALALRQRALTDEKLDAVLCNREQTLEREPALGGGLVGGLLCAGEGQVDNRRLGRALLAACENSGVHITANVGPVRVECNNRRALGVATERGFVAAAEVINAAGAWSGQIAGVPPDCIPPVFPVKGQMLTIEVPIGFMHRVTWAPGVYLVPREDGRLLVGATVEHDGFDTRVTAGGIESLLAGALRAAPALGRFAVSETWAGLRPGSPDGRPFIGPTRLEHYFLAAGHFRNGILLSPLTAWLLAETLSGRSNEFLEAFHPARALTEAAAL